MKKEHLRIKDLATIGIFSAIMIVVFILFSIITGFSLFFNMIFNAVFVAFILSPFYVYMVMKVNKRGVAFIYNFLHAIMAGLLMTPFMFPWFIAGGILAELALFGKNPYKDMRKITLSWILTSLTRAAHGMACIWFFKDAFMKTGVSAEQLQVQTKYYLSTTWVSFSLALTIIASIFGCLLANKIIKKHFVKTGII